ncbi:hypothetical protein FHP25_00805 [Vineibacter terrae]|uniref:Uncharacterized protein n=1 Tax=Vineibacter terrae TaxID=2586908 RepID=A0A5C8PW35_9HYPH|nr:hypothetical protein [Vineibacter terrae]TXL82271.1 hypothetical protein FHP25_00805 [Vineibacter terrae]
MLLAHHALARNKAAHRASPSGQLFVACVVVLMLVSIFSETWEIASLEADVLASDIALEFLGSLGLRHWNLIELILAGGVLALALSTLATIGVLIVKAMTPADRRRADKVPI